MGRRDVSEVVAGEPAPDGRDGDDAVCGDDERGEELRNYVFVTEPQSWFAALDFTDAAAAAARIAQEFDGWAPSSPR